MSAIRLLPGLLFACLLASCSPPRYPVEIPFSVHYAGQPISCTSPDIALTDLRFFLHDLRLGDPAGRQLSIQLDNDGGWQDESVALLDLENGQGACVNGSAAMNAVVRGTLAELPGQGLEFTIGVPESLNHANMLVASPPLNDSVMHWQWLSGYKFLRAGIETSNDGFWMHLGSTRCRGTMRDIKGCDSPNRPSTRLPDFVAGVDEVVLDLAVLFAGIEMNDGVPSRCMSEPSEPECHSPLKALNVERLTASPPPDAGPVFRLKTRR